MKKNIGIKILVILTIIAICLISFIGVYKKDNAQVVDVIPEYKFGMKLSGAREVVLKVSDHTEEVVYDEKGNVAEDGLDDEGNLKDGYRKENVKENKDEVLTQENFKASKEILEKRLKTLNVQEYEVRQNNEDGTITVQLPENSDTDDIIGNLSYKGKFEIIDSETKEVLLDNSFVKDSRAVYNTTQNGTVVSLNIEFNKEGKEKFKEITKTYVETTNEDGEKTTKEITINLDDEKLTTTHFDEVVTNGNLQLSIGSPTTSNETIASYIKQASQVASLIAKDKMEIKYEVDSTTYISSSIDEEAFKIGIISMSVIVIIALGLLCIKYKSNGVFASISYIGFIAALLLVLRYTNIIIELEGIAGFIAILIVNFIFTKNALEKFKEDNDLTKDETIKEIYKNYTWLVLPMLIISVILTFVEWLPISSVGMIMFWGVVTSFVYNYLGLRTLLEK